MDSLENGGKLRAMMTESGEYFGINCGKTGQTAAEKLWKTLKLQMTSSSDRPYIDIVTPVDKNIDKIIQYNTCQFKMTENFHHTECDAGGVNG